MHQKYQISGVFHVEIGGDVIDVPADFGYDI